VRFGSEMHNCYRIVCTQEVGDELSIAKVVRIISICKLVEVNHLPSAGLEPMQNKVSAEAPSVTRIV
jgi:hypothetical protein